MHLPAAPRVRTMVRCLDEHSRTKARVSMALAWLKLYLWWEQESEPSSVSPRRAAQSPLTRLFERRFFSIAALLLVILAGTQIGSAVLESPTNDEPIHLTAGYVYLTTGKYSMDITHPPLGRVLAALPLLPLPLK